MTVFTLYFKRTVYKDPLKEEFVVMGAAVFLEGDHRGSIQKIAGLD